MSSPIPHCVWHVVYSRCVPVLSALTLSTFVVAAQSAPTVAAQPEAAASPAVARAYLGTVSGGLNNTASGVAATVGGGFGNTASGYYALSANTTGCWPRVVGGLTQTIQLWNIFGRGSAIGQKAPGGQRTGRKRHISEKTTTVRGSCLFCAEWAVV